MCFISVPALDPHRFKQGLIRPPDNALLSQSQYWSQQHKVLVCDETTDCGRGTKFSLPVPLIRSEGKFLWRLLVSWGIASFLKALFGRRGSPPRHRRTRLSVHRCVARSLMTGVMDSQGSGNKTRSRCHVNRCHPYFVVNEPNLQNPCQTSEDLVFCYQRGIGTLAANWLASWHVKSAMLQCFAGHGRNRWPRGADVSFEVKLHRYLEVPLKRTRPHKLKKGSTWCRCPGDRKARFQSIIKPNMFFFFLYLQSAGFQWRKSQLYGRQYSGIVREYLR